MAAWLTDAIFYEIYPQSFCDSNADGIGDMAGILSKMDYIEGLGCNALWINPCFASPFVDAGYDISDYYRVAPRYGTNADLKAIFSEAHKRGMHVLLDLVPGHTSVECNWFKESARAERNEYTDRYIWTDSVWEGFEGAGNISGSISGGYERDGTCATNFFSAQPALNYGFAHPDPKKPWQQAPTAAGPMATREAIKDVMRFWLGMGCDGFRVDMAGSLVKNDDDQEETIALWQDFRAFLDKEFPDAVMVSEWGQPDRSLRAGYHMDFLLQFGTSHYLELFRGSEERPKDQKAMHPYFSREGKGDAKAFFDTYVKNRAISEAGGGLMCVPSGNHDMIRMARTLDAEEMKIAFAFILSMPGAPFIYYGDEIGMKYVEGLASVEGGYHRTGSRSPMAWDKTANAGFSAAPAQALYIKQDESKASINVETEEADKGSLLNTVKALIALRRAHSALMNGGGFELLQCEERAYPIVYRRTASDGGKAVYVVINPSGKAASIHAAIPDSAHIIYAAGGAAGLERLGERAPAASAVFLEE